MPDFAQPPVEPPKQVPPRPNPLFTPTQPDDMKAVSQTLLETRRLVRSIEAALEALVPLTDNEQVVAKLVKMQAQSAEIGATLLELYTPWARVAFKA